MDQSLKVVQTDSPSARLLVGSRAVEFVVLVAALCHTASRFGTARRTGGGRDKVVQGGAAVYSADAAGRPEVARGSLGHQRLGARREKNRRTVPTAWRWDARR